MGTLINIPQQTVAGQTFSTAYAPSQTEMSGGGGKGGTGLIASNVISGLNDIATSFINAKRTKNVYKFNAAMAQLQGRMKRLTANVEIKNIRKQAQVLFSTQRALYAKAGVKMEGSPAEVMMGSLKEAELDAIYLDISATYNVGLAETQAGIYKMEAESAKYDAYINMYKTLLTMGTSYLKKG